MPRDLNEVSLYARWHDRIAIVASAPLRLMSRYRSECFLFLIYLSCSQDFGRQLLQAVSYMHELRLVHTGVDMDGHAAPSPAEQ